MMKMATLMKAESRTRKMKSASTLPAVVEALTGQSGKLSNVESVGGLQSFVVGCSSLAWHRTATFTQMHVVAALLRLSTRNITPRPSIVAMAERRTILVMMALYFPVAGS